MDNIMKPFIAIYHVVSKILSYPSKILRKTSNDIAENIEEKRINKGIKNDSVSIEDNNFEGLTKKKEEKVLISYRYTIMGANKRKETGIFDAESEGDVKGFFESQGYQVLKVEKKKKYDIELGGNGPLKAGSLSFSLTQLSTYIKAGIPLVDAVRILARQSHKTNERRAYERLVYDLLKGENLSDAMIKQGKKFPKLLINMVKTAEMTGDLPTILDDMSDYYTSMEKTRKQMISAMTYPAVVIILAIGVLIFMLMYLVPQFVQMFESQDATLPAITLFVIGASDFLKKNYLILLIAVAALIFLFYYLFKNVKEVRITVQKILMHLPVFGNIIIYNEIANFTKTFASLLNHGVFITDSMEILSKITNNEVYKNIIAKTLNNLSKGDSISSAFKDEWAIPIVAYEMLVTGEKTGQLGLMMEKVADHFQELHKTMINQMKSLIEPLMIVVLAVIVGIILLSIVVPMFDIYGKIQ